MMPTVKFAPANQSPRMSEYRLNAFDQPMPNLNNPLPSVDDYKLPSLRYSVAKTAKG